LRRLNEFFTANPSELRVVFLSLAIPVRIRIVADCVALSCQVTRKLKWATNLDFTTISAIIFISGTVSHPEITHWEINSGFHKVFLFDIFEKKIYSLRKK
jgi:hypothetical protein